MPLRAPGVLAAVVLGAGLLFWPHGGSMGPSVWFGFGGPAHPALFVGLEALLFFVVYFGTLKFWELVTGDKLPKPIPTILAVWLGVRLTVDCVRYLRWW